MFEGFVRTYTSHSCNAGGFWAPLNYMWLVCVRVKVATAGTQRGSRFCKQLYALLSLELFLAKEITLQERFLELLQNMLHGI
jgi:hypothetical protein